MENLNQEFKPIQATDCHVSSFLALLRKVLGIQFRAKTATNATTVIIKKIATGLIDCCLFSVGQAWAVRTSKKNEQSFDDPVYEIVAPF
jgi:hypothetical protein